MRSGRLRYKVRIERHTTDRDDLGQTLDDWILVAERRADINPLTGREYFEADTENSEVTTQIRMRYDLALSDITSKDRITHGSTVYDIQHVINHRMRNREFIVLCKVVV